MATNYISDGDVMPWLASGTITSGAPFLAGARLAVPLASGVSGETVNCAVEGVFKLDKATGAGTNMAQGGKAYWDDTAKKITGVASGNTHIGYAWKIAGVNDTTCEVSLGL